ncbi:hypothetical protein CC80DRAFT_500374 [Byssothecium circinans]|uniref:Uncharacterized protein n=1 Tax=Byssothecium circinans TaxID=147558 RepID=A0A6A5UGJ1_9PLEO|nr:hypothetical protein CC80DRAFT_500374 [Byssothecium circinans]
MLFFRLITSALCLWGVQGLLVQEESSLSRRAVLKVILDYVVAAIRKHAIGALKTIMHSSIRPSNTAYITRGKGLQIVETTMLYVIIKDQELYKDSLAKYCIPKDQYCAQPGNTQQD